MAAVKKGVGIFKLDDSDHNVGSQFSFDDVLEILHIVDIDAFHNYLEDQNLINSEGYIDEMKLYGRKVSGEIRKYMKQKYVFPRASWDEYVICAIIRRTYPDAEIEQQSPVRINGRLHTIDIKLHVPSLSKVIYIEVDGTSHFVPYQNVLPKDPRLKLNEIKKETGCEAYSWPYWIQRSSHNLKVLLGQEAGGYGALWTSNVFFKDFCFKDSATLIKDLSKPFDVEKDGGVGYFYELNPFGETKLEHFILDDIRKDKSRLDLLVPKGAKDRNYWLPKEFQA